MRLKQRLIISSSVIVICCVCGLRIISQRQRLDAHVGWSFTVGFSKALWVGYLSSPSYDGLTLIESGAGGSCFRDPSNRFNRENLGARLEYNLKHTTPTITKPAILERADGSFCVADENIDSLSQGSTVVWRSGAR